MLRASLLAALVAALLLANSAIANEAVPPDVKPKAPPTIKVGNQIVKIEVESDNRIRQPVLTIPTALVQEESPRKGADAGPLHPAIIGLALTCAFVTGGLWMVRGRKAARTAAVAGLLAVVVLFAGLSVQANAPSPVIAKVSLPVGVTLHDEMVISFSPDAKVVTLRVPAGDLIKLAPPTPPGGNR
jgi:hypothetical protein